MSAAREGTDPVVATRARKKREAIHYWLSCAVCTCLGAKAAWRIAPSFSLALALLGMVSFVWMVPPRKPNALSAGAALLAFGVFAWTGLAGFAISLSPTNLQEPGQGALGLVRIALLFATLVLAKNGPKNAHGQRVLAVVATLFLASLAMQSFLVPYLIAGCVSVGWLARIGGFTLPRDEVIRVVMPFVAALPLFVHPHSVVPPSEPSEPASAISWWRARGNNHRAHYRALQWALVEGEPGFAYIALAEVDLAMGHADKAHRVLSKVIARGSSPAIRDRARALDESIGKKTEPVQ